MFRSQFLIAIRQDPRLFSFFDSSILIVVVWIHCSTAPIHCTIDETDIKEFDDKYEVEIDLPGFKKDEVQVELKDGYLVVSAEKGLDEDEKDKKSGKYLRRERYAGSCQRSYYVGKDTTEDDIKAHFEHGMLTVTVAKKEAKPAVEEKKHIAIEG